MTVGIPETVEQNVKLWQNTLKFGTHETIDGMQLNRPKL